MSLRDLTIYGKRKATARSLRQASTSAEELLWDKLRNRQLGGLIFRRQVPLGVFFADFCCMETKLVIELDGEYHKKQLDADNNRTIFFEQRGFKVLRFSNQDVLNQLETVCGEIVRCSPFPSGEGRLPQATG